MKRFQQLFLFAFLVFLTMPTFQYFGGWISAERVNEHREAAAWPKGKVLRALALDKDFATRVETYFSDHFPLRALMLRLHGQLEYSLLGVAREVVVGNEGWLSDKKLLVEHLPHLDAVDEAQLRAGIMQLKKLQHWLQQRNVRFLMVVVPLKPTIYPAHYPQRYTGRAPRIGLQKFQEALALNDISFIDVHAEFARRSGEGHLYYKTDMHWSTVGVSYVAAAIVDRLSQELGKGPLWSEQLTRSFGDFSGEELKSIPLLWPRAERAPRWASSNPAYVKIEMGRPDLELFRGTDPARAVLPPTVMYGNSFMLDYPTVGYHNYFSESSRVLDYQFFAKVLDAVEPKHKVFILHVYETQLLYHLMPSGRAGAWSGFGQYWDPRVEKLPLPPNYQYRAQER